MRRWLLLAALSMAVPAHAGDLIVSAAISLSDAFKSLAPAFEHAHAGTHVVLNFGASDVLLKQIEQGAPADVFASADEATMDRAAHAGLLDDATRRDFAGNALVLIVATGNPAPAGLRSLSAAIYPRIAVGDPATVPAGRYAKQALDAAGLWDGLQPQLVLTQNVRQALAYVARGEAQAGFVYATDAATQAGKVRVALTVPTSTPVRYPIAVIGNSAHAQLARAFVAFVGTPASQATLQRYGFTAP